MSKYFTAKTLRILVEEAYNYANTMATHLNELNAKYDFSEVNRAYAHFGLQVPEEQKRPLVSPDEMVEMFALQGMKLILDRELANQRAQPVEKVNGQEKGN